MRSAWITIIVVIVSLAFIVTAISGASMIHHRQMRGWASDHGYTFVTAELRAFSKGPFWYYGKGTTVYYATLRDKETERHFWFGFWWGMTVREDRP